MFGFIRHTGISRKTSWWQINHLRQFWSCIVLWRLFFPSRDGIPLGTLDGCWEKINFLNVDELWTPSETGSSCISEVNTPSLVTLSCTCGLDYFIFKMFVGRNPCFASLTMDLGCSLDNFSYKKFDPWCNSDSTSGNNISSIVSCVRFLDSFLRKFLMNNFMFLCKNLII